MQVILILGSKSDLDWGKSIGNNLDKFGIPYIMHIASAHKTPEVLMALIRKYDSENKSLVYICVAGRSNALGGFTDAQTVFPVINCPPQPEKYAGLDILSSLRMPSGVGCMTVLEPDHAALAAAKILGLKKEVLSYQNGMKDLIIQSDKLINKK
jgi:5-(carboxyamino)imidazole ribonucleotide mutase